MGIEGENRQDEKEPHHAQPIDAGEADRGPSLGGGQGGDGRLSAAHDRRALRGYGEGSHNNSFALTTAPLPEQPGSNMDSIRIRGARTHNLKNLDLDLPRDRLIVLTGLSGSGKSSLAFDTIYAEGQRRYVESLSAYARQFLSVMDKPDLDHIEGLSTRHLHRAEDHLPQPALHRRDHHRDPRLPAAAVRPRRHAALSAPWRAAGGPDRLPDGGSGAGPARGRASDAAGPGGLGRKGEYHRLIAELHAQGFVRARIDGGAVRAG